MLLSMLAFLAGNVLMAMAPADQPYWANTLWSVLIMPFGMDMSNPSATILLSNAVPREHQGIAASLVVTVVNYSISTSLGFAANIESSVSWGDTADNILAGFRSAQYFGIEMGGLGVLIALAFALRETRKAQREDRGGSDEKAEPPRLAGLHRTIYNGGRD
jgi:MFS family permease